MGTGWAANRSAALRSAAHLGQHVPEILVVGVLSHDPRQVLAGHRSFALGEVGPGPLKQGPVADYLSRFFDFSASLNASRAA